MDEQERLKLRMELHKAYVEESNRREAADSDNYDKAILGYSTGALALSVTFISTVVKDMGHAHATWSLKAAWICWIAAIATTIASFLVSMRANRVESEKASTYYNNDDPEALKLPNPWATCLKKITVAAGAMFTLGAALMMVFVWVNLGDGDRSMTQPKTPDANLTHSGEGLPPPHIAQLPKKTEPPAPVGSSSSSATPTPNK